MPYQRKTYDLFIHSDLREVLEKIKNQSLVARLLIKQRHTKEDLVADPVNFISVSSQDASRISYLTTERIGLIDESEYWGSSRRFHAKPGGFISKIFKNVSQKEVELFSNLYRAETSRPEFSWKIVKGEDIRTFYHYSNHVNDYGSLGVSCMRYDSCQATLDLYVKNPDQLSLLLMLNREGRVLGRALLWEFQKHKIMDRIYSANDEQLQYYFKNWAMENKFWSKSQQNWYNSLQFDTPTGKKLLKLDIKVNTADHQLYPYLDTFKFFDPQRGTFSHYRPSGDKHFTLCSTDGSKYGFDYLGYDDLDKIYRHRGEIVWMDYLQIHTHAERCRYSDVLDSYILCENACWKEKIRDYIYNDQFSSFNNYKLIDQRIEWIEDRESKRQERDRQSRSIEEIILEQLR